MTPSVKSRQNCPNLIPGLLILLAHIVLLDSLEYTLRCVVRHTFKRFLMMRRKTASLFWNDNDLVEAIPLAMDTNEESDNEVTIYAADVVVSAPAITW